MGADAAGHKLGAQVAATIQGEIMDQRWPVGSVLGTEPELVARHQVSRPVLREAIRILESRGVARSRSGPGGGLVVTQPDWRGVCDQAAVVLDSVDVTATEILQALNALVVATVDLLVSNLAEPATERLRAVAREQLAIADRQHEMSTTEVKAALAAFEPALAELSGNRAFALFTMVLVDLVSRHGPADLTIADVRWVVRRQSDIAEAIVSGDSALARGRIRRYYRDVHRIQ